MTTGTIGLDVGKTAHHACAMTPEGEIIYDQPLPQNETELRKVFTDLQKHGTVLVVVDQPNTIGALPVAVARDAGCMVGYLPGLAMRKAADLNPGRSKTDRRDAFIVADTARTMPRTLRAVDRDNEVLSALKMLSGFDDDIAKDATRTVNRLRSLLTQIYPSQEHALPGSVVTRTLVLDMLIHYGGQTKLKKACNQRVHTWTTNRSQKDATKLVDAIFDGLKAQTVTVPGTAAAEVVIPQLATNIKALLERRKTIAEQLEELLENFPLSEVLMSMPGVGIKTAANILLAVGDRSDFRPAGHLAAYAGIAPETRRSETTIRGEFPARAGNKRLENALFYPAFASIRFHEPSKTYYDRKREEEKRHNAAVMCLARRRCNVIYAMLTRGEIFREIPARTVASSEKWRPAGPPRVRRPAN